MNHMNINKFTVKPKTPFNKSYIGFYLDSNNKRLLIELSNKHNTTITDLIRQMIEHCLK